jgi:multisubunit Na+/H+ antiporter MnhE subunit
MPILRHPLVSLALLLRFLRAVVVSGWQTVQVILRASVPGAERPAVGFIRMRFAPMSEQGAALLGCMISLTPGTTTIDIDMERHEMLLHMLDTSDAASAVAGIRHDFERYLVILFGRSRA